MSDYLLEKGFTYHGKRFKPMCMTPIGFLTYKKHKLYILSEGKFRLFTAFPCGIKGKIKEISRVVERITRCEPQYAII